MRGGLGFDTTAHLIVAGVFLGVMDWIRPVIVNPVAGQHGSGQ